MTDRQTRIDVAANRQTRKWSRREQAGRMLWTFAAPLFRFSPRPLWGWRRALLRAFGARVGRDVHVYPTARITIPWNLTLEDGCAVGDSAILGARSVVVKDCPPRAIPAGNPARVLGMRG